MSSGRTAIRRSVSKAKAYVVREERENPVMDFMSWEVLGGQAS